jgi:hypothetical protein
MNYYKAAAYYQRKEGLKIFDQSGVLKLVIHGESTNEIESTAKEVLRGLNAPFLQHKALTDENKQNFEMGIITPIERDKKQLWIDKQFK